MEKTKKKKKEASKIFKTKLLLILLNKTLNKEHITWVFIDLLDLISTFKQN